MVQAMQRSSARGCQNRPRGFTLVELLVVMVVIGLLLSVAAPRYFEHVNRAKEVVLKHNLAAARQAIDKFYADRGRYPASLQELVQQRYLRSLPLDPVTDSTQTWQLVPPPGQPQGTAVYDLHSGAQGSTVEGEAYASW